MKSNTSFKKNAPKDLKIIDRQDELYHYARVISNTRFGKMPMYIAYCKKVSHVQYCINYCREHTFPFRVRSGGHQHEGMCSANDVIIIDLSEINIITPVDDDTAWIPAGKQLGQVYSELEEDFKTIPGGGCQSVNVGGLTQGGGWGTSVRKFGLTCDSVTAIEMVLANGKCITATKKNKYADLFWAVRGGGGGNFGVVIRFKFKLVSILPVVTTFRLEWKKPEKFKPIITKWAKLHATKNGIVDTLSATCTMTVVAASESEPNTSEIHGRMAGKFYGTEEKLKKLLRNYFGKKFLENTDEQQFTEVTEKTLREARKNREALGKKKSLKGKIKKSAPIYSYTEIIRMLSDYINPTFTMAPSFEMPLSGKEDTVLAKVLPSKELDTSEESSTISSETCANRNLTIVPDRGPSSTCDQPHPHKVSSSFPKDDVNHKDLVESIYTYLKNTRYQSDVNMYMSFHCMGGAVTRNAGENAFGYAHKPYMLQIQAWWDDVSNAFTNQCRNIEYLKWVKKFRKSIKTHTEGAFINFVDKTLVADIEDDQNRLKLLEIYYTKKNLKKLRKIKSKRDADQLFNFEMSILPSEKKKK
ncbi:MAG: FAD-binding protein [Bacteroidota bacterium]